MEQVSRITRCLKFWNSGHQERKTCQTLGRHCRTLCPLSMRFFCERHRYNLLEFFCDRVSSNLEPLKVDFALNGCESGVLCFFGLPNLFTHPSSLGSGFGWVGGGQFVSIGSIWSNFLGGCYWCPGVGFAGSVKLSLAGGGLVPLWGFGLVGVKFSFAEEEGPVQ